MSSRFFAIASFLLATTPIVAQEAPVKIEKSEPKGMTNLAPNELVLDGIPTMGVTIVGDPDVAPTAEACSDRSGEQRNDCMYLQVLEAIRTKMGAKDPNDGSAAYPVEINFAVNQFGDIKSVRVVHTGPDELSNKVTTALYGMPKFTPAVKAGANVGSSVTITYPYETLFAKEE